MSETRTYNPMPDGNPNAKPTKGNKTKIAAAGKQPKENSDGRNGGDFLESRAKKFNAR
jgi:hypothetical protein